VLVISSPISLRRFVLQLLQCLLRLFVWVVDQIWIVENGEREG
jgi:hypothetical protein